MCVLIEGFSVVVRNSTLAAKYSGGIERYHADCPNRIFCADEFLTRVGFIVLGDAELYVANLAAKGLTPYRKGSAEDVALVCPDNTLRHPCSWLELGEWGRVVVGWLAGKERGNLHAPPGRNPELRVRKMSWEEIRQQLEFIRTEGNVDVYRDKSTDEEFYVGRPADNSDKIQSHHDDLYRQASGLIDGLLILGNRGPGPLVPQHTKRLESAIPLFAEVVQINPGNWAAMWLLGKVHQRLGEHEHALAWFLRAHRLNPDQSDIAREAAITAMELGRPEEATAYCERALETNPGDPGLQANLALTFLFSGNPEAAQTVVQDALSRDPSDHITARIARIIREVLQGKRSCPRHVKDLS